MGAMICKTKLRLVTGAIADQGTEAVVTAHWRLYKGTGNRENEAAYSVFAHALQELLSQVG